MALSNFMCSVHGANIMMGMVQAARKLPWNQASPQTCPQKMLFSLSALFTPGLIAMSDGHCWNHPGANVHDSALKPDLCSNLWEKGVQRDVGAHPSLCCPMPRLVLG